jgi:NAD(P)-dependent dehydrogenase (short-subunit alcohol dehydrogenase family)
VVAVNHRPEHPPAETLQRIAAVGAQAFAVAADMRDPGQVESMVRDVVAQAGRLDYVVSNAAINPLIPWDQTSIEQWDELNETNLRGTWVVATEGAKEMIREGHGGAMVFVSSISAHVAAPGQVAYTATKAGISMLAKSLGAVLGEHGIRVNAVEPGSIDTKMSAPLFENPADLAYYTERIALHRIGRADEIAGAVAFLLSDEASYVTSATLLVDGGFIVNAER